MEDGSLYLAVARFSAAFPSTAAATLTAQMPRPIPARDIFIVKFRIATESAADGNATRPIICARAARLTPATNVGIGRARVLGRVLFDTAPIRDVGSVLVRAPVPPAGRSLVSLTPRPARSRPLLLFISHNVHLSGSSPQ